MNSLLVFTAKSRNCQINFATGMGTEVNRMGNGRALTWQNYLNQRQYEQRRK